MLCLRCKFGIPSNRWRAHARLCFGIEKCLICEMPFPCCNSLCDWKFPTPPAIPEAIVPYFVSPFKRDTRWKAWRDWLASPERMAHEPAAHAWLLSLSR